MKKKILLILSALFIFYMPLSKSHQEVQAVAVASKVVNASAKKIAKEVVKDTAVQMSMNMVIDYKYTPKDRTPKEGYSFICMPRDKTSTGDCAKPVEMKTQLTATDKQTLSQKVEVNLDKKIAGGIGATKWGKFLDWFVPIFSIGMGVAVIDYAMNGDVSDLFDEIAYDTLVEMGLMVDGKEQMSGANLYSIMDFELRNSAYEVYVWAKIKDSFSGKGVVSELTLNNITWGKGTWQPLLRMDTGSSVSSVLIGERNGIWVKRHYFPSPIKVTGNESATQLIGMSSAFSYLKYHPNADPPIEGGGLLPKFDETGLSRTNPTGTPMKIPSPGSLPFTKTDTGEQLLPYTKPDGTTGYKTRTGVEVNEDAVSVGNPVITENPDGSKTVKKQPTVATPNPSPSEDEKIPTKDDEITEGDLEGLSCTRLKKPDFKPLTNAFTTSFPFSIPWDLQRMFNAAFSEIGSNEPNFEYKFEFNGQIKTWKIGFPDYFANWTNFTRPLLLIIFDIGLIYAIYRFTKGSD